MTEATENTIAGAQLSRDDIVIKGARVNNLKNVDVRIPRNKFVVITGLSGSGKSSLAFDTLYAEGQRRYVESLSAYARQFMGKMSKPDCDYIKGLPPAIAIEQKVNTRNPRSTVGTSTEIYDYLRLLFAKVGRTYSPVSGAEVKKHTVEDVLMVAASYPEGTKIAVTAPVLMPDKRSVKTQLDIYLKGGYTRLLHGEKFVNIAALMTEEAAIPTDLDGYELLVDRLASSSEPDEISRLSESIETAFYEGHDSMTLVVWADGSVSRHSFSKRFEADGIIFPEPNDLMFNFNNPYGACSECEGYGRVIGIDERLVVPNPALSVFEGAVVCWRGDKMGEWKRELVHLAPIIGFPIHTPYRELTQAEKDLLWHGDSRFGGIDGFFKMVDENQYKIQYRVLKSRYLGKTICPSCHGSRLRREVENVKVGGATITQLVRMPVNAIAEFFDKLTLEPVDAKIAERVLRELRARLGFLREVGLGYLTLDRMSMTLSGGESQRINLATSLGSSLVGSLYILDEPSIGLHTRDTERLVGVLKKLRDIGNTVVVVEHDEDIMREADYIIDVGPDAGRLGGRIVYQGPLDGIGHIPDSYTSRYLAGEDSIDIPVIRRRWNSFIEVTHATEHNLKDINVKFPLGVLTVVTGVSGSGKSTLVRDILYRAMVRHLGDPCDAPGAFGDLRGDLNRIEAVDFIDQNPIGKSTRSNPATYLKAFDEIRKLFAEQQSARQMGFGAGYFSFNAEGGRCEECKGEGVINIEMQFMADITIPCEACHGRRFKRDVLEVTWHGKNISDVLDMTVNEAIEFFGSGDSSLTARIVKRLRPLQDVGLGYIKLGQSSSTLSGGENQRVKLAYYLSMEKPRPTMFIFDEPTTGLHFHDIKTLMRSFDRLIERGHTVIIIEHNLDVVKCADHVIDIGPEGGDAGGELLVAGTPEEVAGCGSSFTGLRLRSKLAETANKS